MPVGLKRVWLEDANNTPLTYKKVVVPLLVNATWFHVSYTTALAGVLTTVDPLNTNNEWNASRQLLSTPKLIHAPPFPLDIK